MTQSDGVLEITIWYRGVVEGRLARRIGNCLADAARSEGKFVQAFDNYVDLPDRVYVPCRFYVRISGSPIVEPYLYENYSPSVVICTDAAQVKGCGILRGIVNGGMLLVNTSRAPEFVCKLLEGVDELPMLKNIATVDAGVAREYRVPYGGVEGASEKAVSLRTATVILGAVNQVMSIVSWESLKKLESDVEGFEMGSKAVTQYQNPCFNAKAAGKPVADHIFRGKVDLVVPAPVPNGTQPGFITGNYRFERPVLDAKKCTGCRICWASCPDACIAPSPEGKGVSFDLEYCKGCGICWYVCPAKAITPADELDFEGGMVRV